jgi:5-bromo-4-chloroindolyl phosphate hydrolysis protein
MARETDGGIQAVKAARNQALWREVNERIRAVAETSEHMEFLCECADLDCTETLNLTVAEYEHIRSSPVRFPIAIGHYFPQVENVVEENERYAVVQKRGVAAEEAARLNPRSPG